MITVILSAKTNDFFVIKFRDKFNQEIKCNDADKYDT